MTRVENEQRIRFTSYQLINLMLRTHSILIGETPVLLSSRIVDRVRTENSEFYQALKTNHVRYIRTIDDRSQCKNEYQKSWQDIYDSDDKSEVRTPPVTLSCFYVISRHIKWL
jgi:hypothetical protein